MTNTITEQLPEVFTEDRESEKVVIALTEGIATIIDTWLDDLENYESRYLDPATADPEWLDYLAYQLGWEGIWQSSWDVEIKRQLLTNSMLIWSIRGSREALPYLLEVFGIEANLTQTTGWKVGTEGTPLPADLTLDPFSYILETPFTESSTEYKTITLLIENFIPCWVRIEIQGL